jgi:hypothetical protein
MLAESLFAAVDKNCPVIAVNEFGIGLACLKAVYRQSVTDFVNADFIFFRGTARHKRRKCRCGYTYDPFQHKTVPFLYISRLSISIRDTSRFNSVIIAVIISAVSRGIEFSQILSLRYQETQHAVQAYTYQHYCTRYFEKL